MTPPLITDVEDWTATVRDGFTVLTFELDPGGRRIRITGFEHSYDGTDPIFGSMHSLDAIDGLADALKEIVARGRRG